ncbi:hypothetical protein FBU30_001876 [Linnemannia zychae]|nr:hypothetical protein FBU30_001876 [Linnemannia zychae]
MNDLSTGRLSLPSLFGAPSQSSASNTPTQSSPFGVPPQPSASSTSSQQSCFGAPSQSSLFTPSQFTGFGAPSQTSLFTPPRPSLFGTLPQPSVSIGQSQPSLFNASSQPSLFNVPSQPSIFATSTSLTSSTGSTLNSTLPNFTSTGSTPSTYQPTTTSSTFGLPSGQLFATLPSSSTTVTSRPNPTSCFSLLLDPSKTTATEGLVSKSDIMLSDPTGTPPLRSTNLPFPSLYSSRWGRAHHPTLPPYRPLKPSRGPRREWAYFGSTYLQYQDLEDQDSSIGQDEPPEYYNSQPKLIQSIWVRIIYCPNLQKFAECSTKNFSNPFCLDDPDPEENLANILLSGCRQLRVFDGSRNTIHINTFEEHPLVCCGILEVLRCQLIGFSRLSKDSLAKTLNPGPEPDDTILKDQTILAESKRQHQVFFETLAKCRNLRVLDLGPADKDLVYVDVGDTETEIYRVTVVQGSPALTLFFGLAQLETLTKLEELNFEGVDHRLTREDVIWMALNFKSLRTVSGVHDIVKFSSHSQKKALVMDEERKLLTIAFMEYAPHIKLVRRDS